MLDPIVTVVPELVSRGLLGIGALTLLLFVVQGRNRTIVDSVFYLLLVAMVLGTGTILELNGVNFPESPTSSSQVEAENDSSSAPPFACTDEHGRFGIVQIRLNIFNANKKSHGYGELGLPKAGDWLISTNQVKSISTSDRLNKRWGARWDCVVGPQG